MHRSILIGGMLPTLLLSTSVVGQAPEPEVTLKVVKYAGLGDTIKQLRGKVVVVDFWATY